MEKFRLTRRAHTDIEEIGNYTRKTWGDRQAAKYLTALDACLRLLASSPQLGRRCDRVRPGYRRFEHARHVVFFRTEGEGILVVRILHAHMLPAEHEMGEEEE